MKARSLSSLSCFLLAAFDPCKLCTQVQARKGFEGNMGSLRYEKISDYSKVVENETAMNGTYTGPS